MGSNTSCAIHGLEVTTAGIILDGLEAVVDLIWIGHNGSLMGIKRYIVHYGPVSPWAVNGPRVTKCLIWAERRHGPDMGQKLQ